jgi:GTP-binding protein
MNIKSAAFAISAPDLESCPKSPLPEFAFIGRSNVGKSSLINMLVERRDLALVSDAPGKTKLINYFLINDRWHLVDLPGYGYAGVSHQARDNFARSTSEYLAKRRNLHCVFVLIDSRLEPQRVDLEFLDWARDCKVPLTLVFTKTDKQSAAATQANVARFTQALRQTGATVPETFISSSKTKLGRAGILAFIEQHLAAPKPAAGGAT